MHSVVNVRSIKMAWRENNKNNKKNTQFNYLLKSRYVSEVINPISLGMEPIRALLTE